MVPPARPRLGPAARLLGLLAFAAGLSAAVHLLWTLGHLADHRTPGRMAVRGIDWWDDTNFTARGLVLRHRLVLSMATFAVAALAFGAAGAAIGGAFSVVSAPAAAAPAGRR
jgi:hypothetical protein